MIDMMIVNTAIIAFGFLMLWAAFNDVRAFKIPNWIPGLIIVSWVAAAPFMSIGLAGLGLHLAVFAGVLSIGMALWSQGFLGGGDVKLIAAGALWFGWPDVMSFIFIATLAGGVLALGLLVLRRFVPVLPLATSRFENTVLEPGAPAPYGVAIAAGALWVLPQSAIFAHYIA